LVIYLFMTKQMVSVDKVAETNLRRLLRSCEKMSEQAGGVLQKDTKRTFEKYLAAAQKQRNDLAHSNSVSPENLDEYSRKIAFLQDLVNTTKLTLPINTAPTMERLASTPRLTSEQKTAEAHARIRAQRHHKNTLRSALLSSPRDIGGGGGGGNPPEDLSREEMLESHRSVQQSMIESMVDLSSTLKYNSEKILGTIRDGNKSLNELNSLADTNVTAIRTEKQRLQEYSASTSWSTLSLCVILMFVVMIFVGTYMFMKLFPKI